MWGTRRTGKRMWPQIQLPQENNLLLEQLQIWLLGSGFYWQSVTKTRFLVGSSKRPYSFTTESKIVRHLSVPGWTKQKSRRETKDDYGIVGEGLWSTDDEMVCFLSGVCVCVCLRTPLARVGYVWFKVEIEPGETVYHTHYAPNSRQLDIRSR